MSRLKVVLLVLVCSLASGMFGFTLGTLRYVKKYRELSARADKIAGDTITLERRYKELEAERHLVIMSFTDDSSPEPAEWK